jgi:TPR repeat protein
MNDTNADINQDLASGIAAFEGKHFSTATRLLQPLADQGNEEAQFRMAIMAQNGLGMVVNEKVALENMMAAAKQGHALAMHGLGFMYLEGECTDKDPEQAAHWFNKAADAGMQGSMTTLAMMYRDGNGVEQNQQEADRLFKMAGFDPSEFS